MSKSRGNVVNPDDIVKRYGADTLRMYEMFLGPHDAQVSWNDKGVIGVSRFLDRVWQWGNELSRVKSKEQKGTSKIAEKELHKLIKKITEDIESYSFNTSVSSFMQFVNNTRDEVISKNDFITFLQLLYPFAPHISEELYELLGGKKSLQLQSWPMFDQSKIIEENVLIIVQINGKVRDKISMPVGAPDDVIKKTVLASEKVKIVLGSAVPKKIIIVKNKLVNLVI
jgi:leucyl-tRNA synthetase